ncbi:TonB-dependent receptor [Halosquirtibacter xylanolyticus]|uniref:SusC/RagA family TonB-linked outer membrane protein n=1 Tax=Halosquirtibacter xylanolyticus TaxID=3374599 RepID=UPI003749AF6D|nr:TonB-dependent receptor [Prolixibacteraceae bacterium]
MKVTKTGYFYNRFVASVHPIVKRVTYASFAFAIGINSSNAEPISKTSPLELQNQVQTSQQKQRVIKGTVTDHTGETLPGVSVAVVGGTSGTVTDVDGNFSLKVTGSMNQLKFSFVGMKSQVVDIKNLSKIDVTLKRASIGLDEVVAIGFGTQKKSNLTGSVASVGAEAIDDRPVSNATEALQGKVAGLSITTTNAGGTPGSSRNIRIRGYTSLTKDSGNPYILVDGIEMSLDDVNPDDIEDITVLKDAASSAIYGSRAAYGVILVTTKKGKKGIRVSYSNNFSFSKATNIPDVVESPTFARYFNLASENDGSGVVFSDEMLGRIDQYYKDPTSIESVMLHTRNPNQWGRYHTANANTDWYKEQFKAWAPRQTHNITLNGASEKTSYYLSTGYYDQSGLLAHGHDNYKRYTLNAKIDSKVNKWLKIKSNVNFNNNERDFPNYNLPLLFHEVARAWPTNPVKDPNGYYLDPSKIEYQQNGGRNLSTYRRLALSLGVDLEPVKDWVTTVRYNARMYSSVSNSESLKIYEHGVDNTLVPIRNNSSYYKSSNSSTLGTPQIFSTYELKLDNGHNFKIMAGAQTELYTYDNLWANKTDLVTDKVPSISTAVGEVTADDGKGHWSTQSVFSRFNYNYKEKYLIEVNWRADGSSRFKEDKRWGQFPSVSMGWDVAKEEFLKPLNLNQLKLRASYGSLGNQNVPNYQYIETINVKTNLPWIINGERPVYTNAPSLISPSLTWETVAMKTLGLDFALLNNRLSGSIEGYERTTSDMLGPADTYPATLGTSAPWENNAALRTRGWELAFTWKDQIADFKYSITGTLANYWGEVTKYNNKNKLLTKKENGRNVKTYYVGQELGEIWGYESDGLFQSQEEIDNAADQTPISGNVWQPGDVRYKDLNGDGKIDWGDNTADNAGDKRVIGNSTPKYQYGITLTAKWKGFDMSMFWQGVAKRDVWIGGPGFFGASGGKWQSAAFVEHMDYWTPENTDAYYPRPYFSKGGKNQQTSTRYLQDASYLRLKSLQVGYTIPKHLLEKISIKKVRFYVSGENLLTFTSLSDVFDPEAISGGWGAAKIYPLQMVLSAGVNINF